MNTRALLMSCGVAAAIAAASPAFADAADEAEIRDLEARSWVAWKAHDGGFFEQFLSDDHIEVHNYGITGKAAVV
jgi:hypothetical protein